VCQAVGEQHHIALRAAADLRNQLAGGGEVSVAAALPVRERVEPRHAAPPRHTGEVDDRPARTAAAGARGQLDAVETAYSDAEHDLATVLTQPTLFDAAHPLVARFRNQHELARQQVATDLYSWTAQQSVADLEASWHLLRSEARRAGISGFSRWQRRRIRRGGRLLELARSDRGSPQARLAQYFRALRLLDGLIELPEALRREVRDAAVHTEPPLRTPGPDFPTHW